MLLGSHRWGAACRSVAGGPPNTSRCVNTGVNTNQAVIRDCMVWYCVGRTRDGLVLGMLRFQSESIWTRPAAQKLPVLGNARITVAATAVTLYLLCTCITAQLYMLAAVPIERAARCVQSPSRRTRQGSARSPCTAAQWQHIHQVLRVLAPASGAAAALARAPRPPAQTSPTLPGVPAR